MKTFTPVLILLISLFIANSSSAQIVMDISKLFNDIGGENHFERNKLAYEDIKGSPYLQEDFIEGLIIINDSSLYKGVPMRYNVYNEIIEFEHPNGTILEIDNPDQFREYIINDQAFIYHTLAKTNKNEKGFYEVLVSGKLTLAKKYNIELKDPLPPQAYKDAKPAEFSFKPSYYYIIKGNQISEVSNEKNLLEAISSNQNNIKSYIKKNKLKVKKEDDLKNIIEYYNSL
ncbi:hypothetical protein ACUNWD_15245 [Sunxiuqinia sp. A32]|uniref:hypothetical protein n=1 Tax=Sunxiuqinia sp. A32 TaxID=3461496 RepID=UPI00404620AD